MGIAMALTLYYHPLASFCHKVLIALYEKQIPFTPKLVDFGDPGETARFLELWPVGKIPLLHDTAADRLVPETTIILEYLDQTHPATQRLLPEHKRERLDARLWDRFFDFYVQTPMQKIVTDRLRAHGEADPRGVIDARAALKVAYGTLESHMASRTWAIGERFTIADCAAAPALFYAAIVEPFGESHPHVSAYFERLLTRESFQQVVAEAQPYLRLFPYHEAVPKRFL
jgi:glutathione S-transferase